MNNHTASVKSALEGVRSAPILLETYRVLLDRADESGRVALRPGFAMQTGMDHTATIHALLYLETVGVLRVRNTSTGDVCELLEPPFTPPVYGKKVRKGFYSPKKGRFPSIANLGIAARLSDSAAAESVRELVELGLLESPELGGVGR